MSAWDLGDPGYEEWLRRRSIEDTKSRDLLLALVSEVTRREMFTRWHAERCNPVPEYTADVDRAVISATADELADRLAR